MVKLVELSPNPADAVIAELLTIAPATLKKRWARIYETMETVLEANSRGENGHRGAEAWRHVVHYVRHHPEELHPHRAQTSPANAMRSRVALS